MLFLARSSANHVGVGQGWPEWIFSTVTILEARTLSIVESSSRPLNHMYVKNETKESASHKYVLKVIGSTGLSLIFIVVAVFYVCTNWHRSWEQMYLPPTRMRICGYLCSNLDLQRTLL